MIDLTTEDVARVLSEHMDRGTSGRLIADYGVTVHSLATAVVDVVAARVQQAERQYVAACDELVAVEDYANMRNADANAAEARVQQAETERDDASEAWAQLRGAVEALADEWEAYGSAEPFAWERLRALVATIDAPATEDGDDR